MKYLIAIALVVAAVLALWLSTSRTASKQHGTVIILNGPSAAGKSSIQKEFQKLMMPHLWIKLGIDSLFDAPMPEITLENMAFWQKQNPIRWVETTHDQEHNPIITLLVGDQGEKVVYGMNSAIAAYAQAGCNIIVDYIGYKKEWLNDLEKKLKGINTLWVKVSIPLEILEQRETARGTSPKGHARSHHASVYGDVPYDLEVHSDTASAAEIAQQIKTFFPPALLP